MKNPLKRITLALALALPLASLASEPAMPPGLKAALASGPAGLKVHKQFPALGGLTGWVLVRPSGDPLIVFSPPDGSWVSAGALLDDSGVDQVPRYLKMHQPIVDHSKWLPGLQQSTGITQGATSLAPGAKTVWAFFDPACPHCSNAFKTFKAATEGNPSLSVRWIPVAFLQQKSAGQAAAILSAPNPLQALEQHERQFSAGGLPAAAVTGDAKTKLDANLALFRQMGLSGVPAVFYSTEDGRVDVVRGAPTPADMSKIIAGAVPRR